MKEIKNEIYLQNITMRWHMLNLGDSIKKQSKTRNLWSIHGHTRRLYKHWFQVWITQIWCKGSTIGQRSDQTKQGGIKKSIIPSSFFTRQTNRGI